LVVAVERAGRSPPLGSPGPVEQPPYSFFTASVATSSNTGRVHPATHGTPPRINSAARLGGSARCSAEWHDEITSRCGIRPAQRLEQQLR
jgi:hypothetical protein